MNNPEDLEIKGTVRLAPKDPDRIMPAWDSYQEAIAKLSNMTWGDLRHDL